MYKKPRFWSPPVVLNKLFSRKVSVSVSYKAVSFMRDPTELDLEKTYWTANTITVPQYLQAFFVFYTENFYPECSYTYSIKSQQQIIENLPRSC